MKHIVQIVFSGETLRTSTIVGLIVGMILNLINQGDVILAMNIEAINFTKFIVTFFVPFSVSTYSTVVATLKFQVGSTAKFKADLSCAECNERHVHIKKNDLIPACGICVEKTDWQQSH